MKKNILTILILASLLAPFYSQATSTISVATDSATDVTMTSAILHGHGGEINPDPAKPLKTTAYFRYSTMPISPIYCNDIYGTSMISTGDINLGTTGGSKNFYQRISNLAPDTTYYYCAIVSNKDNIAYGGQGIVREFRTKCEPTSVITESVKNIQSTSATLAGSYCSTKSTKTYFEYREVVAGQTASEWKTVGSANHDIGSNNVIYGNFSFILSGLTASKNYTFKAVAENGSGATAVKTQGAALGFTTLAVPGGGSGGGSGKTGGGGTTGSNPGTSGDGGGGVTGGSGNGGTSGTSGNGGTTGGNGGNGTSGGTSGSGTNGNGGAGNNFTGNGIPVKDLKLGQMATPPSDAIVRYREGIETVLARQIIAAPDLAKSYGYIEGTSLQSFAGYLAHVFARMFGYVDQSGREIRVSTPDVAAYQLVLAGNKLTIYEYYSNQIVDIREVTTIFKTAYSYEYYFRRR